jgi:hypothetical protein
VRLTVSCIFEDGSVQPIRDFTDLLEASKYALSLAERHATDPGDGHGPPSSIDVLAGRIVFLSVKVLSGGLSSQ